VKESRRGTPLEISRSHHRDCWSLTLSRVVSRPDIRSPRSRFAAGADRLQLLNSTMDKKIWRSTGRAGVPRRCENLNVSNRITYISSTRLRQPAPSHEEFIANQTYSLYRNICELTVATRRLSGQRSVLSEGPEGGFACRKSQAQRRRPNRTETRSPRQRPPQRA
jgi:hypothetical protein